MLVQAFGRAARFQHCGSYENKRRAGTLLLGWINCPRHEAWFVYIAPLMTADDLLQLYVVRDCTEQMIISNESVLKRFHDEHTWLTDSFQVWFEQDWLMDWNRHSNLYNEIIWNSSDWSQPTRTADCEFIFLNSKLKLSNNLSTYNEAWVSFYRLSRKKTMIQTYSQSIPQNQNIGDTCLQYIGWKNLL